MLPPISYETCLPLCALLCFCLWLYKSHGPAKPFFPGPPSEPLLGHIRSFPPTLAWFQFTEWGKKYGEIVQLFTPGRSILVLSNAEDARNLLEKRGSIYSDRPRPVLHGELGGMEHFVALMRYGDEFRTVRRYVTQYFNSRQHITLLPLVSDQVKILLKNLLDDPERFENHIDRASSGTIVKSTYGYDINSNNDSYIKLAAEAAIASTALGTLGLTLVDLLPILRFVPTWLPGANVLKRARYAKELMDRMIEQPYERVISTRDSGAIQSCFLTRLLDEHDQDGSKNARREMLVKHTAAQLYLAGVTTLSDGLLAFVFMMMKYPRVMKKAQSEIDRVVGGDQLPSLDDRDNLPYIECILKETYRINPSSPLNFPHVSTEEDEYKGKIIPAGTYVISNIWAMMRDKRYFSDPETFNPDRFLDVVTSTEHSNVHPLNNFKPDDPASLVFGFGRRICPGRYFADASSWLIIASVLAVFDILPPIDPVTGKEYLPKYEWFGGQTSKLKSFPARFVTRSEKHAVLIQQEYAGRLSQ